MTGLSPSSTRQAVVGAVMRGIRRVKGVAPRHRKAPLLNPEIRELIAVCGSDKGLRGLRNRALILIGYTGAFRRSELARLTLSSVDWNDAGGVILHLGRSKTDQEGVGRMVAITGSSNSETCPILALRRWIDEAGLACAEGPLFRAISHRGRLSSRPMNPASVSYLLKRILRIACLNEAAYGAHSLRSGFCTQAHLNKATDAEIMQQTSHRSRKSLDRYIRPGFGENAAAKLNL